MIGGMLSNKKLNPVVTELFIRGRNLNISIISYHAVLFITYYLIMKLSNKREW